MTLDDRWIGGWAENPAEVIQETVLNWFSAEDMAQIFSGQNEHRGGRTPYSDSWHFPDSLVTLYANPKLDHILIEFSGQCCEIMRQRELMGKILEVAAVRGTRIDIACDIETTTTPDEFVGEGHSDRFQTTGRYDSPSGQTVYIGSQKSERFCRVYRYAEPHPRAKLLRVEYVMRRDHAKAVARECRYKSIQSVVRSLGEAYKWASGEWQPEEAEWAEITVERPEKARKNAVRWLITQVAPAFQRLVREGNIVDPELFLKEHFLNGTGLSD